MRSPDPTDVERIEGLLRGVPPESEREAHLEGLIRELRGRLGRAAPPARARALARAKPRRTFGWKPVLVIAPLVVALAGAALLGGRDARIAAESAAVGAAREPRALQPDSRAGRAGQALRTSPLPATTRAQEWDVSLELALRDNGAPLRRERRGDPHHARARRLRRLLERRDARAERPRRLSSACPSAGSRTRSRSFSELGTITGQQVSIQDRQATSTGSRSASTRCGSRSRS